MRDKELILTKNKAIEKITTGFGRLSGDYQQVIATLNLHKHPAFAITPKISRGEKHEGLPWLMLDYPRQFQKDGQLAVRSFFWWGNYYSIQLQVSGCYLKTFLETPARPFLENDGWLTGLTSDAWDLNLPNGNWKSVDAFDEANAETIVFKVAKKIPIDDWEVVETMFKAAFVSLANFIAVALSAKTME